MKKLVLMFVAIAAISLASCHNNTKPAQNPDSTADSTVDSLNSDSAANTVAADSTAAADSVK
ncbi:MAG: entericidin [Prevotella sp.]|nr:entericidin [Prevotella sp.]